MTTTSNQLDLFLISGHCTLLFLHKEHTGRCEKGRLKQCGFTVDFHQQGKNKASHPNIDGSGQGNENWYKCYGGILKCACKFMREKACYPNGSCWLESYPHGYDFSIRYTSLNVNTVLQ